MNHDSLLSGRSAVVLGFKCGRELQDWLVCRWLRERGLEISGVLDTGGLDGWLKLAAMMADVRSMCARWRLCDSRRRLGAGCLLWLKKIRD